MPKKYFVEVREVHVQTVSVEADSPEQAIKAVKDGSGLYETCEYSHTLDSSLWTVDEQVV